MQGVIYTRVSSDEQVKGMSLDFQREDCLEYAKGKNITVRERFEEKGESAKFADRPELLRLLDYCKKHKGTIKVLIVWKLDRLSRNQMDYYFLKRTLLGYGIAIHSVTEPSIEDSSSIEGKIFETFTALQAEIDNTMRRDRAIRGMEAKIASGIYPWRGPLGYRCAKNKLRGLKKTEPDEPDPERFPLIRRIFATCLTQRTTNCVALAKLANSWGLRTETGKRIYPQLVDRMLNNIFYAGILVNPWSKEEVQGKHEPVISPEDFFAIQLLRKGRAHAYPTLQRPEHPDFPLRRTVRCGDCASPITGSWSRGNGGKYAYYHCPNKRCATYGKAMRKTLLEEKFADKLNEVTPKRSSLALLRRVVLDVAEEEQKALRDKAQRNGKRLEEFEARLDRLIGMKERELLSDDEFLTRKEKLRIELAAAQSATSASAMSDDDIEVVADAGEEFVANLPSQWLDTSPELRRRFQKSVFPEGIPFTRGEGFGTAKLGLIYEISQASRGSKTHLVHLVRANWNRLLEEFRLIGEMRTEVLATKVCAPSPIHNISHSLRDAGNGQHRIERGKKSNPPKRERDDPEMFQ